MTAHEVMDRIAQSVERLLPPRFSLGSDNLVTLRLRNPGPRSLSGTLRDDYPDGFVATPDELTFVLPAYAERELCYRVTTKRRGRYDFKDLHLRLDGAFGLGSVLLRVPARAELRVYPNPRFLRRYQLAARLGVLHGIGVRTARKAGGGGDLEEVREYVPGDPFRDLDWKATAKRLRPITRVYGQEQAQTVVIALDVGHRMAMQHGELTKLDHAIHAVLLLTWVAFQAGDEVGLIVFADEVQAFLPPRRGSAQYRRVLEALHCIEASATYVDFRALSEFVRARVPKRSLILLFSDLLDQEQAVPLCSAATSLRAKHLPVCVTMSDPVATALSEVPAHTEQAVYQRAAAADLLAEHQAAKTRLRKAGVGLLEADAGELAVATVNRYLEIKARHAL